MGCDGGTIPKRGELVRTKKKPEEKDKESDLSFKWGHCSITQEPLQTPIVACQLGRLYNKTSVIEAILDQTKLPDLYKHVKSLKDVKELNFTDNPAFKKAVESKDSHIPNTSPYICPVIGLEMNGKYRFIFFWSCGCVISERALKAVNSKCCHKCQKPVSEGDVIVLNGTEEDTKLLEKKMLERQSKIRAEKKMKKAEKSNKNGVQAETTVQDKPCSSGLQTNTEDMKKISSTSNQAKNVNGVNGQNCSRVEISSKRKSDMTIKDPDFKKTRLDYSIAKDPKVTEVFKSLFTTHKSAEKQNKAHWITYNPFYN